MISIPDAKFWKNFDWWFAGSLFLLIIIGFVNIYSASNAADYIFQWKQLVWYAIGTVVMLSMLLFDYRILASWSIHIYIFICSLLIAVIFFGKSAGGAQRWLPLGFMNLQPSEFTKLIMVIVLSSWFFHNYKSFFRLRDLWQPFLLTLLPVFLIFCQPDLGTAAFLLIILASIVYIAHLRWTSILILAGLFFSCLPLLWKFAHPYQRRRVLTFLDPESDPLGSGYHVIQSKIAIGSGQLWGKGYMKGSQAHLNFLPEVHTDFAFSIWCEEWGFIGAVVLLFIFFFMLYRGLKIASNSKEYFGAFMAFGITAMLFWQAIINICMVIGYMPVVGIPLPFISYGGSSVITSMAGAGIILNISGRRFMFQQDKKMGTV